MNCKPYLCRLPFRSGDGSTQFLIMGQMVNDPDEDFRSELESGADMSKLPFCVDCCGELVWAEPVYGIGARKCMQCGSVFQVVEPPGQ